MRDTGTSVARNDVRQIAFGGWVANDTRCSALVNYAPVPSADAMKSVAAGACSSWAKDESDENSRSKTDHSANAELPVSRACSLDAKRSVMPAI